MIVILLSYGFVIGCYGLTALAYSVKQRLLHSNLFLRSDSTYGPLVSKGKRP
jgi:hypothetical protein